MRRLTRRRIVPYKSPRLFTMLALLVCLVLMMNSLRSMRGPGPNAQRIISNLDKSINQVKTSADQKQDAQQADAQQADAQQADAQQADAPVQDSQPTDSQPTDSQPTESGSQAQSVDLPQLPVEESNRVDSANLNLREDLELQDWLGVVQDGALQLSKLEMPAYWRILDVVKNSSFSELLKAAESKTRFNDLYLSPSKNRSKLLTLNVKIRRITRYDTEENPANLEELFEVWAWSEASMSRLYVFVTPELPPGLDANTPVNQNAKFAGYFYKLQGYHPGDAKPNAKPELAPLLIGRFEVTKAVELKAANPFAPIEWLAGGLILIVGVIAILLRILVFSVKKPKLNRAVPASRRGLFDSRD